MAKARPDSARVPLTLANFLRKYDRVDEAILQWRDGLAKEPQWDDSWRNLGFGLEHLDAILDLARSHGLVDTEALAPLVERIGPTPADLGQEEAQDLEKWRAAAEVGRHWRTGREPIPTGPQAA